tara:strand:- start:80486 stop:80743 length:258 start_codon:yes stop_codon:yes gene_type:complete
MQLTEKRKREIILQAMVEFGSEPEWYIQNSSDMGLTLYADCWENTTLSRELRKTLPHRYHGLRTVVLHRTPEPVDPEEENKKFTV